MSYTPPMVKAQVLYDNRLRDTGATITYDGTVSLGMEPVNAYDWRDFTLFSQSAGSNLVAHLAAPGVVDTICLWISSGGGTTVTIAGSNDGSAWTTIYTGAPVAGIPVWVPIASVSYSYFRVYSAAAIMWRQITMGAMLQFPMGQWADVSPPLLVQGVVVENQISVNGSIIGRNLRRFEKSGQLSLDYLTPDWIRTAWDTFVTAAIRYPFWWRWDPVGHPAEVAFTAADSITAPKNSSPPPLMHAEMSIKFLTT